ncbi:MAG TPA: ROK family protein [Bacteroidales bacterium]|nr:ROK family protein [Bacteroidales bacterium]HRZ50149.1 ROK family protein [Bacteroidales bacterium]
MDLLAIGADVGGSHITAQVYNLSDHTLLEGTRHRVEVDSKAQSDAILDKWAEAIRAAAGHLSIETTAGVGFAMPGPFDYPGGIAWFKGVEKYDHLYGINVREELRSRLGMPGNFRIRFLNDASSFAIGESFKGRSVRFSRFLAITLGTGFGSTFIRSHIPVAGEAGTPPDGFLYDIPFNGSNADNHFSTRWFLRQYQKRTGHEVAGVKQLAAQVHEDPVAEGLFSEFGRNLGGFLSPWLRGFEAEGLVIGGNIANAYPLFRESMSAQFSANDIEVDVVISELQEDAAISGAALLCDDTIYAGLIVGQTENTI